MFREKLAGTIITLALVTVAPTRAAAAAWEFTPVVGHFTPLKSQVSDNEAPLVLRQTDGTAFGARLGALLSPRMTAEVSFLTASPGVTLISNGDPLELGAVMIQLDARARIRVNDSDAAARLDIIAGFGVSNLNDILSNMLDDTLQSPSTFTIVLGLGGTVPVTDRIKLRFDIEDHIHDPNYEIDEEAFGGSVKVDNKQHDIMLLAGIVIPLAN